jgi:hypothetical protein
MLEPSQDRWDWSYLDSCLEACARHDMQLGLFCWPQHAPGWFLEKCGIPRLRCLEHGQDSRFLSLWSPRTVEAFARFYQAVADRFGTSLAMVYVGSAGCFGEPQYPQGVTHYRFFADTHNHAGFWCGDELARRDFGRELPAPGKDPQAWVEFARWYTSSLTSFVDQVCTVARRAFPRTPLVMPVGTRGEPLATGQDKWQIAQVAARHGMTCRWTGCGNYEDFAATNVDARRISSACRLLGCEFGTESALYISAENGFNCIYEQISNGVTLVHDDPGNFARNRGKLIQHRALYQGHQPRTRIACFYSKLQQYFNDGYVDKFYAEQCVRLRARCDFEILDEDMIAHCHLDSFDLLISFGGWVGDGEPTATVQAWLARGGRLIEWMGGVAPGGDGFQSLGQAVSVEPSTSFDDELTGALAHVEIRPGLTWSDIRSDTDRCYVTAFEDGLLCYNAATSASRLQIAKQSHTLAPDEIKMMMLLDMNDSTL